MSDRYDIPEKITLAGGIHAMLTTNEANQFHEYMNQQPAFNEAVAASRDANVLSLIVKAGAIHREAELRAALERADLASQVVANLSRKWYADLLAKDERPVQPIVGTDSHKYETQRK